MYYVIQVINRLIFELLVSYDYVFYLWNIFDLKMEKCNNCKVTFPKQSKIRF